MSKRRLSEAMAVRSPLARREAAEPAGTPTKPAPGRGTAESPVTEDVAPDRPDASGSAGGTVANRGGRDDEVVVLEAARPARPHASMAPVPPTRGTPWPPGGQEQGQAALERWLAAQRELSDAWFGLAEQALPVLSPGLPVGWGHTVLRAWRETTRQVLDAQAAWLRCWAPRPPTR